MKAYRFFSDPNRPVTDAVTGKRLLKFDEKGEYVTLDPILVRRMETRFRKEEIELVEAKEQTEPAKEPEPVKTLKCKKCDFETDNNGALMAHYRKDHKKEG
jgi:hypothetical protein